MSVIFENNGEIDPRLISTFGVNVKEDADAIGFFGTGLKYALAILLRGGHKVTIQSGLAPHEFSLLPTTIRGKNFDFIAMDGYPLGFTAEVGKTWKLWMAYRELFCNCQDEHGTVYEGDAPEPTPGLTRVIVEGDDFLAIRRDHDRYFMAGIPLYIGKTCRIHRGPAHGIYYRGVLVGSSPSGKPMLYGYDFTTYIELTEDRTAKHGYMVNAEIAKAVTACTDQDIVREIVTAPKGSHEHDADFDWPGIEPSKEFLSVVGDLMRTDFAMVNPTARAIWEKHARSLAEPEPFEPDDFERQMMARAVGFCQRFGYDVTAYPIVTVESIGPGVLGMARNRKIYVARKNFTLGTKQLAATLIEEFIHLRHNLDDCSLGMQEHLLNSLVTMGERLQGEPL